MKVSTIYPQHVAFSADILSTGWPTWRAICKDQRDTMSLRGICSDSPFPLAAAWALEICEHQTNKYQTHILRAILRGSLFESFWISCLLSIGAFKIWSLSRVDSCVAFQPNHLAWNGPCHLRWRIQLFSGPGWRGASEVCARLSPGISWSCTKVYICFFPELDGFLLCSCFPYDDDGISCILIFFWRERESQGFHKSTESHIIPPLCLLDSWGLEGASKLCETCRAWHIRSKKSWPKESLKDSPPLLVAECNLHAESQRRCNDKKAPNPPNTTKAAAKTSRESQNHHLGALDSWGVCGTPGRPRWNIEAHRGIRSTKQKHCFARSPESNILGSLEWSYFWRSTYAFVWYSWRSAFSEIMMILSNQSKKSRPEKTILQMANLPGAAVSSSVEIESQSFEDGEPGYSVAHGGSPRRQLKQSKAFQASKFMLVEKQNIILDLGWRGIQ